MKSVASFAKEVDFAADCILVVDRIVSTVVRAMWCTTFRVVYGKGYLGCSDCYQ